MREKYETPELILIGEATELVMGIAGNGLDSNGEQSIPDFEFEQD